jgi:hypothetical protein
MRSFITSPCIIRMIKIKGNELGRAYSTDGGEEECIYDIGAKARRKETTRKTKM